jgi:hypothetical protein
MGTFYYDSEFRTEFNDRVLAHLQIVIGAKLRRGESFYFSWNDQLAIGSGRTTMWMHPAMSLRYRYDAGRMPRINPVWINDLMASANSNAGLLILDEPLFTAAEAISASEK